MPEQRVELNIPRGLIVSCQAYASEPLFGADIMAAFARAAQVGGAVAVHAGLAADLAEIRRATTLPLIGMHKGAYSRTAPYITTTFAQARAAAQAGSDVIEIDGTLRGSGREHERSVSLKDLIDFIHTELNKPVLAGVSCLEDAGYAQALGADALSTFLAGYTAHGRPMLDGPDLEFVTQLAQHARVPVIAEGRFKTPAQVAEAIDLGAHAVLVAAAITRPQDITRRFVEVMKEEIGD
jgi:N-acylglucosamine-6-phosphate 2-epimerase